MVSSQFHYTKRNRFMPFLLAEILNFQGSTHRIGVGSFSNEYISCDSFRIRLNWLPFQAYGIWRYTVPLVAVGEKSCVSHSIAEEIDGIHPEW